MVMSAPTRTENQIALIGAGPAGLAAARWLNRLGIAFQAFEAHADLGGLWNPANPQGRTWASLRMISSQARTAFSELPMGSDCPPYPGRDDALRYLQRYAERFALRPHFRFGTLVRRLEPVSERSDSLWRVTVDAGEGPLTADYKGVLLANGTHAEPRVPRFPGRFDGELMHASAYRDSSRLAGRRVLVIGGGNSGCDIAVDAAGVAATVHLSVKRGMHLWPRWLDGQPADDARVWWQRLPRPLRLRAAARQLRGRVGQPALHGFPPATHALDAMPPVVNDELLPLLARGALQVRPEVVRMDGRRVHFGDGRHADCDLVIAATGYRLHYPFLRAELLNWHGAAPRLYLNMFPPHYRRLAVLGMLDGQGLGWRDLEAQAELAAHYLRAQDDGAAEAAALEARIRGPLPDLRADGARTLRLDRLAHAVDAGRYRAELRRALSVLGI